MKTVSLPTSNIIALNRNSTREDRSKYLAQVAVSKGRHLVTLREARENVRVTTKEAAGAVGITERTLKKWEIDCGRADIYAIDRLCKYYGISMDHVHAGKEADLLAARRDANVLKKKTIDIENFIAFLRQIGSDTTELDHFVEDIRSIRGVEKKNAPSVGAPETFIQTVM